MVHPGQVSFLDPAFPPTLGANAREPHRSVKTATGLSVAALEEAAQVADPVEVAQMADQVEEVALEVIIYRVFHGIGNQEQGSFWDFRRAKGLHCDPKTGRKLLFGQK